MPFLDLTDRRFGRLMVIGLDPVRNRDLGSNRSRRMWFCKCDCGGTTRSEINNLVSGNSTSCGCLQWESYQARTLPDQECTVNRLWSDYVKGARKRNLIFDLYKDEFKLLIESRCWYCSKPPEVRIIKNRRKAGDLMFRANGIDRIDNNIGYTFTNSVSCCASCNFMKGPLSLTEFLYSIDNIPRLSDYSPVFQEII